MPPATAPSSFSSPTGPIDADVAVLGAGFSGSVFAVNLCRSKAGPSVLLIEKSRVHGAGLAYGDAGARHLLNVPAGRMGAFPDTPEHFLDWVRERPEDLREFGLAAVEAGDFLPRLLYGRYLTWLVSTWALLSRRLTLAEAEVLDMDRDAGGNWILTFADGRSVRVRTVVLALGNFASTHPSGITPDILRHETYIHSPWAAKASMPPEAGDVLLLGTGLTAVDMLATLKTAGFRGKIHLLSRRGLLPRPHAPVSPHNMVFSWNSSSGSPRALLREVRREIKRAVAGGVDWRAVIDSLRAVTQEIWRNWNTAERARFLRHVRPYWEVVRHRAAPQADALVEELRTQGRLLTYRGRLQRIESRGTGAVAVFRPKGTALEADLQISRVINCTGPETNLNRTDDPLAKNLIQKGWVTTDSLGLGLEVNEDGAVIGRDGTVTAGLHALGGLRKGRIWESTAVPELRQQAAELATLLQRHWNPEDVFSDKSGLSTPPRADFIWAYEI